MSERNIHDPQDPGAELPVEGAVDTVGGVGTTPGSRLTSIHLFPFLASGVELLTGFFNRLETQYSGTFDGKRIGRLVMAGTNTLINLLSHIGDETEEGADLLTAVQSTLAGPLRQDLGVIASDTYNAKLIAQALGFRKVVGIDAGAYVAPAVTPSNAVTFTGVNLLGRVWFLYNVTERKYYRITNVVDPSGGAVGTLTLETQIATANSLLLIPYTDTPHAWNSAADALQTLAVVGDPPRINGPATFISQTAITANGTYQWVLPCALYGRFQVQIIWSNAANNPRTFQFRSYGKVDDVAWPVPGGGISTINPTLSCDDKWDPHTLGGATQFGAAPAVSGTIVARMLEQTGYNSIAIEAVVALNDAANASTVTAYVTLYGATK